MTSSMRFCRVACASCHLVGEGKGGEQRIAQRAHPPLHLPPTSGSPRAPPPSPFTNAPHPQRLHLWFPCNPTATSSGSSGSGGWLGTSPNEWADRSLVIASAPGLLLVALDLHVLDVVLQGTVHVLGPAISALQQGRILHLGQHILRVERTQHSHRVEVAPSLVLGTLMCCSHLCCYAISCPCGNECLDVLLCVWVRLCVYLCVSMCVSKSIQDNHHAPLWDPGRLSCIAGTVAELLSHPLPLGTHPLWYRIENEDADLSDVPPNPHP